MEIPLAVTGSIERDRHEVRVELIGNGKIMAAATAGLRMLEYYISPEAKVALLPDEEGLLEDILLQAGADYKVISDHYLRAGELDFYDVFLLGTGCFQEYGSLVSAGDRLREYVKYGGAVLIFGQSSDRQADYFPVSLIPQSAKLCGESLMTVNIDHPVLRGRYGVDANRLIEEARAGYMCLPADVFPGEGLIVDDGGGMLLSETALGKGRIIYCGLPLTAMMHDLNPEGAKLFSNLIDYLIKQL